MRKFLKAINDKRKLRKEAKVLLTLFEHIPNDKGSIHFDRLTLSKNS